MNTIEKLTTVELYNLERQYDLPKTFEHSAILKGIKAELAERKASESGIDEGSVVDLKKAYEKADSQLSRVVRSIDSIRDDVVSAQDGLDEAFEKVAG